MLFLKFWLLDRWRAVNNVYFCLLCTFNESFCIHSRFLFVAVSNQSSIEKTNSVPSSWRHHHFYQQKRHVKLFLILVEKSALKYPVVVEKNATFALDTSCFNHPDDFKADDNGSFRHHDSNSEFIKLDDDGEVSGIDDPKDPKPGEYKLTRTYWIHSSTKGL